MPGTSPSDGSDHPTYPDYVELGREPARTPRRGLVVAVVAAVAVALGLPLGAFAVMRFLGGGGTQPHDVLPANAVGYFRVDLDPSGAEKIDALRFLRTFPAFERYTRLSDDRADVRKAIFEAMVDEAGCDLTFAADVAPWLGQRFGAALTVRAEPPAGAPADMSGPDVVAAVQVTDEQAAREGLAALRDCALDHAPDPLHGAGDAAGGWAYLDGYMLLARTRAQAVAAAESARRSALGDNEQFRADMERLGDPGVASLWFSGAGMYQAFRGDLIGDPGPAGGQFDLLRDRVRRQVDHSLRSGAVAFRFDPDHAEVATVLTGAGYRQPTGASVADLDLPGSTAVAAGLAGGAELVDRQWDALGGLGDASPAALERRLGLELPADLQTLLGDSFTVALDGSAIDLGALMRRDLTGLDLGVRAQTDPAGFTRVLRTLEQQGARHGVPLRAVVEDSDAGVVAALDQRYARHLAAGTDGDAADSLTDTEAFRRAVPGAADAQAVLFVHVDKLERAGLGMLALAPGPQGEAVRNASVVEAVGLSAGSHDGYAEATLRVTVAR